MSNDLELKILAQRTAQLSPFLGAESVFEITEDLFDTEEFPLLAAPPMLLDDDDPVGTTLIPT